MEFDWSQQTFVKKYNDVYSFGPKAIAEYLTPIFLVKTDRLVDFGCGNGSIGIADHLAVHRANMLAGLWILN